MLPRSPALNAKRKSALEYWMPPIHLKRWLLYPVTALSACPVTGQDNIAFASINNGVCFTWDEGANDVEIVDYH